ncbi:isoleucine--tRNA ligase [Terribacillus saccharophilus]|uniref:Isoleucine--tRNA ligase n=1 Tax=Terribacillus saccharophilus TaxID=361277 RepID=A0A268AA69_9BACI|nr:isoleucine--tRNA ligase [Terribacillus saccharophilus]PAD21017.1 isoleucine--tRNA ligase [Terribacillus saccharophilus]PAF38298.1 isoleucine--tRNA ligase [Terribacillus saccharophilus]PAF39060.1 isoleucine--tRNA ligase [Terribacillus saccharophilus]
MDYKETLLMPETAFPMRGNLPNKEPKMQQEWEEQNIYKKVQERTEGRPLFVLHDGPPYANGDLHMGHALNKVLKDFIVRYKSMSGFHAPYVPGWDTHGLPIEQALTKKKVDRKKMTVAEFRRLCAEYAMQQINNQRTQFKQLGVRGDWDNPYITLTKDYEAAQIKVFGEMAERGYIYKGMKPVYWSPSSESALAEAEIEYQDKRSASIYVAFQVKDGKNLFQGDEKFIIWTTTPWTLPANVAISLHPEVTYVVAQVGSEKYVVAEDLLSNVTETLEWSSPEVLKTFKGKEAEYVTTQHPFYDRESLIILGEHVTTDSGTGCVHTAPGHGEEDFFASQKYKLPIISPLDDKGVFTNEAPGFEGVFYDTANKEITELLEEKGALLKLEFFTHSYPHDWRTKKPVIYRATAQWFASIKAFREQIIEQIKEVEWFPKWGETRLYNMFRDREDWCISRQRAWGVPIPVFYGENGEPIITEETIQHVSDLFLEHGSNIWFEREAKDLLPEGFTSEHSPNGIFTKETDIMDVWFDSGSSHQGVLVNRPELQRPADLYLEGSDQYRGWFNSSLTTSVAVTGKAPYKAVLSHGFALDGKGKKMSKSLGNIVVPAKIMKQYGADILRLWVASVDYQSDVRISDEIIKQTSEGYRKLRNTFRFLLANLHDFDPAKDSVAHADMVEVDRYMLAKLSDLTKHVRASYDKYEFADVYSAILSFCSVELSAFYLDFGKDILYIEAADHPARRSIQTAYYEIVKALLQMLAPILAHTTEEAWSHIPGEKAESIQLSDFPEAAAIADHDELLTKWDHFIKVRDDVLKALEIARSEKVIGKSLESKLTIVAKDDETKQLLQGIDNLHQLLIVSEANVVDSDSDAADYEHVAVRVEKHPADRCERCWVASDTVGQDEKHPELCSRCASIVEAHYHA